MKLAIDADDVLVDFGGRVIETVNMEYGADLKLSDVTSWNLSELLDPILGEDWWQWWEERDWLWAKAAAIPGAIGGMRRLHQQGHYLQVVTAKPAWARRGLNLWLARWNPYYDELIVGEARPPMAKHLVTNAVVLVDDKPENCKNFAGTGRYALLFDRPHNQAEVKPRVFYDADWQAAPNAGEVVRVRSWSDVLKAINLIQIQETEAHEVAWDDYIQGVPS